MLNEYIRDLIGDMENEVFINKSEDLEFDQYLSEFTPEIEEIGDRLLKENWDQVKCGKCNKNVSILNCNLIDGMIPVCKNGCK